MQSINMALLAEGECSPLGRLFKLKWQALLSMLTLAELSDEALLSPTQTNLVSRCGQSFSPKEPPGTVNPQPCGTPRQYSILPSWFEYQICDILTNIEEGSYYAS